jgi:hypothetical protein
MRWASNKLGWLGSLLLAVASCRTTPPDLKPPKGPEDFRLPPTSDDRFSQPIDYPKNRFEEDPLKAKMQDDTPAALPGKTGPGMTPGHP